MYVREQITTLTMFNAEPTLFEGFALPQGLDRELVIDNLILEVAQLNVIYTRPSSLKSMIRLWSRMRLPIWQKLYNTTVLQYDPIENYDRREEWTDVGHESKQGSTLKSTETSGNRTDSGRTSGTSTETRNLSGSDNETRNLAGTSDNTRSVTGESFEGHNLTFTENYTRNLTTEGTALSKDTGTETHDFFKVAFNDGSSLMTNYDQTTFGKQNASESTLDETGTTKNIKQDVGKIEWGDDSTITDSGSSSDTGTVKHQSTDSGTVGVESSGTNSLTSTSSGTENASGTSSDTTDSRATRMGRAHGNIGVTTTQQMITQEREVAEFDVIQYIIDDYKGKFCVMVY